MDKLCGEEELECESNPCILRMKEMLRARQDQGRIREYLLLSLFVDRRDVLTINA